MGLVQANSALHRREWRVKKPHVRLGAKLDSAATKEMVSTFARLSAPES